MNTYSPRGFCYLCTVVVLIFIYHTSFSNEQFVPPANDDITKWVKYLNGNITDYVEDVSALKKLEEEYAVLGRSASLVSINASGLVEKMAAGLAATLEKKVAALRRLATEAENLVKSYKYQAEIPIGEVSWVNMKSFQKDDPRLTYDPKFRKGVNYNYSGVHIPVEIYEGYPEIMNGLKWSQALDRIFQENLQRDPDLLWQYFGSQAGFMRTYPANRWVYEEPDLYDVRRRPWYIHGSTSPKDMLILMDTSGSMHGQTMEIMKIAVKTLLNTLGENDFVNVAWFSNEANWVTCFDTFVQATRLNKRLLVKGIDELKDGNMASLSLGLQFAFQQIEKLRMKLRNESWSAANCNHIIMLFTDGGTEEPWAVLNEWKHYVRDIRIFVYAIGPHPIPVAIIKQIACTHRGYFSTIGAMGSIRTKVQEYVKVLSRPMVLNGSKDSQWTNFYVDAMGLGMMTTVTLPVFNYTDKQSLVGVVGVDVTLQEMMDFAPLYELGPAGYAFAINSNGFVVFHPDLQAPENYMDDPPQIDILDVETADSEIIQVRKEMIDQQTGGMVVSSLIKLPDGKHMVHYSMNYSYTPVANTSFSIALVLPSQRKYYLKIKEANTSNGLPFPNGEEEGVLLAPWKYCKAVLPSRNILQFIQNLSEVIKNDIKQCDEKLVFRLLWDIQKTQRVYSHWKEQDKEGKRSKDAIATFVITEGGLTRVYPSSEINRIANISDPRKTVYYERAVYSDKYAFIPPPVDANKSPYNGSKENVITVVKSINLSNAGNSYQPAVIGVQLDPLLLHTYLITIAVTKQKNKISCNKPEHSVCYLIDDGGFIVASNKKKYWESVGVFLGIEDPEMMQELWNRKLFERLQEYNFEAQCPKEKKISVGSKTTKFILHDTIQAFNLHWLLDMTAWNQIWYWLYSFFTTFALTWRESAAVPEFALEPSDKRTCTTLMARYYLEKEFNTTRETIKCNNCTRFYSITMLKESNLILIVTTHPCAGSSCDPVPALLQAPREDDGPDICNRSVRYRKQLYTCYQYHSRENSSDCGAASDIPHSSVVLTTILCMLTCIQLFVSC